MSADDRVRERRSQAEAIFEALNARDFAAFAQLPLHPALEFHSRLARAAGGVYLGLEGVREWAREIDETFDGFRVELIEFEEIDEDRVLLVLRNIGTARGSGAPLDAPSAAIWTWRGDMMWRNDVYSSRADRSRPSATRRRPKVAHKQVTKAVAALSLRDRSPPPRAKGVSGRSSAIRSVSRVLKA